MTDTVMGRATADGRSTACDLTICAVTFGDRPFLELNRQLTERLNDLRPVWRMVRNHPVQADDIRGSEDMPFETVEGPELPEDLRASKMRASHHHALGLRVASSDVGTRYVLYLDPDCFIVRRNWLGDVVEYMERRELAFFGVPHHPRSVSKYRYFPCAVCLFVDTNHVDVAELDWTPADEGVPDPDDRTWFDPILAAYLRRKHHFRLEGDLSLDTGFRVYRRYRRRVDSECVQPVMRAEHLRRKLAPPKQRVLEKVLPDRYCLVPKKRGFFTDEGFAAHRYLDTADLGCEEFMWRGQPFALHLRGAPELAHDPSAVRVILAQFA
jgi:hypothetical protein